MREVPICLLPDEHMRAYACVYTHIHIHIYTYVYIHISYSMNAQALT